MLADRLIQDQVKCAQQQEEICVLRQKVASCSKQCSSGTSSEVLALIFHCTHYSVKDRNVGSAIAKMADSLAVQCCTLR